MESRTKNKQSRDRIARMAERAFGIGLASGDDAIAEMKEGWFNATYGVRLADGREVVLKIAPPPDAEVMTYERGIIATEVTAMRLVAGRADIPVPKIYAFDETRELCDAPYFFMEKLRGDNLELVKGSLAPGALAEIRFQIGAIIRAINGFTGGYFGYPGNPDLRAGEWTKAFLTIVESVLTDGAAKDVQYGFPLAALRDVLHKHASALAEVRTPQLVHWDAWDLNIFVRDGQVTGLLDFERALWGDPLLEAQFRPRLGKYDTDVLRGYGKTGFTRDEERRSYLYMWHLGLAMVTECAYRNYDTDEVFHLGRSVVARAMAWLQAN